MSDERKRPKWAHAPKPVKIENGIASIPVGKGLFALVDEADAAFINEWAWSADFRRTNVYALRKTIRGGVRQNIRMHHLILPITPGRCVDHVNGNGLDNRRINLRLATPSENRRNSRPPKNAVPGGWGVYLDRRDNRYRAALPLGRFDSKEEAAAAVDAARRILETQNSRPGFPERPSR